MTSRKPRRKAKGVEPIKAWALVRPGGKVDTAWIGSKTSQQLRAANALRFLKQKCRVARVTITIDEK
jgi:hypothetical protein